MISWLKYIKKYNDVLYGQSPRQVLYLMKLNNQSIFSSSPRSSSSSPVQARISTKIETSDQATSTPVKRRQNVSCLPRKYLSLDNENDKASQSVTSSREKQVTPVIIQNATNHEKLAQKHLALDNAGYKANVTASQEKEATLMKIIQNVADYESETQNHLSVPSFSPVKSFDNAHVETSQIIPRNRRKQSFPRKFVQDATDPKNFPPKHLPFENEMDNLKPVEFGAHTPVRQRTVIHNSKKDRTVLNLTENIYTADQKYIIPTVQGAEMASSSAEDKKTLARPDKADEITSIFTINTKENMYIGQEVQVAAIPTSDDEKNISYGERTKTSDNQKAEKNELVKISYPSNVVKNASIAKTAKMSSNPGKKIQELVNTDDMDKISVSSAEDNKMNITPNQLHKVIKVCGEKRKSPSPRRDTVLFRSIPRIIQSFGVVEIEIDVTSQSIENLSPTTSPISLIDQCGKSVKDSIDKKKSQKEINFSADESKPGSSRDLSPSAERTFTSSPMIVAKANSPSSDNVTSLEQDHLPYKPSQRSPSTSHSSVILTSPRTNNLDPNTPVFYITQLNALISLRDGYMRQILNSLLAFQKDLKFLFYYIDIIVRIIQYIPLANKDYVTEELHENIDGLIIALKLLKKLGSWKMDVDADIMCWTKCLQQIRKIKSQYETLVPNGKPLVTFELLRAYEDELRTKWRQIGDRILTVDSRRSLFLTTAHDLEKLINLFIKCLIMAGILKLSSEPMLSIK